MRIDKIPNRCGKTFADLEIGDAFEDKYNRILMKVANFYSSHTANLNAINLANGGFERFSSNDLVIPRPDAYIAFEESKERNYESEYYNSLPEHVRGETCGTCSYFDRAWGNCALKGWQLHSEYVACSAWMSRGKYCYNCEHSGACDIRDVDDVTVGCDQWEPMK